MKNTSLFKFLFGSFINIALTVILLLFCSVGIYYLAVRDYFTGLICISSSLSLYLIFFLMSYFKWKKFKNKEYTN